MARAMGVSRRALASAAAAALGLGLLAWALSWPPSALDEAARWCRAHARDGDVVVAAGCRSPDEVDLFAPAPAVCADAPPLGPLGKFRRILAARPSPTLSTLLEARFGPPVRGGARVRIYRTAPDALFDLRSALGRVTVSRGGAQCPRRGARHVCAGPAWRTVEPREVTVGGLPLECVFAHPSEDGLALEVPLPAGVTRLRGALGLSDRAAARGSGPPVSLRATLAGREVLAETIPNRRGLRPFTLTALSPGPVRLELTTSSQGARSLCLMLWGWN
jgi:hypothetical protein